MALTPGLGEYGRRFCLALAQAWDLQLRVCAQSDRRHLQCCFVQRQPWLLNDELATDELHRMANVTLEDMIQIQGGTFRMGPDDHYPEERTAHDVALDGFWIDRYAVTNAAFAVFVTATGYVTFAERPLDATFYPGARPELLRPGSAVFRRPNRPMRPRDLRDW
jgi:formylglycine-generating enzyme required for sulfatase activity